MKKWVSGFCAAFSMYSTVPMPQVPWQADTMRYLFCFFPWVGLLIGGLCLGWAWLCRAWHAGEMLFAGGMTLLPLIVSGGIHLDGMVDTADALYSRRETEKKLEILKDPHVGAFGVIVCGGYLLASFALWGQLYTSPAGALLRWIFPFPLLFGDGGGEFSGSKKFRISAFIFWICGQKNGANLLWMLSGVCRRFADLALLVGRRCGADRHKPYFYCFLAPVQKAVRRDYRRSGGIFSADDGAGSFGGLHLWRNVGMVEKLIVGGTRSGKKERLSELGFLDSEISDGAACSLDKAFSLPALYGLHMLVRRLMKSEADPVQVVRKGLQEGAVRVVVCDEIGCGVIPMDRFERDWREQVGRILCEIAKSTPSVERVFCGVASEIKKK